jgi:hypothetical protein
MRKKWIFLAPLAMVGMAIFIAIGGEVVKLLWNWLAPTLFGWRQITFWQAVGLLALCRILFGRSGFRRGFRRSGSWRRTPGGWKRMTAEERAHFRQWLRERWGRVPPPDSNPRA